MARSRRTVGRRFVLEPLEARRLMAAPAVDPIADVSVPARKSRIVPLTGSDADGDALTYAARSSSGAVAARVLQGTVDLKLTVAGFGEMTFQLLPEFAPRTVETIVGLVNRGFYNDLTFHRIISTFMIQGGDPAGNGSGGPGFRFDDEFHPQAIFSGYGQLAMANSGKDTNGSQVFVTTSSPRHLDFNHTIFGQLVRGFDVLDAIRSVPTGAGDRPLTPVVIEGASVVSDPTAAVLVLDAAASGSATITVTADDGRGNSTTRDFLAAAVADAVNDPPILGPVGDVTTATGMPTTVSLSAIDLEGDAVIYGARVFDAVANAGVQITGNVVTITPVAGFRGDVRVMVAARQAAGNTRWDTQVITVRVADQALTAEALPASAVEGGAAGTPLARFGAAVPFAAAGFSAAITWADGVVTAGTVAATTPGRYEVRSDRRLDRFGPMGFSVAIRDVATDATATAVGTVGVGDAPLTAQFVAAAPAGGSGTVSGVVARVADANPAGVVEDLAATIDWGDGSSGPATLVARGGGAFDVVGSTTYASMGDYPVRVTITSRGGSRAEARGVVAVANLAPTIGAVAPLAVAEGSTLRFRVAASDPDPGQVLRYALAPGAPAGAAIDPATGVVTWTPAAGPATARLTVVATDSGSPPRSGALPVSVTVQGVAPRVGAGGAAALSQFGTLSRAGRFDDPGAGPWSATVDYGDGTGRRPLALHADRSFTLSHAYAVAGSFAATVVVTDPGGLAGTTTIPVRVEAVPPVRVSEVRLTSRNGSVSAIVLVLTAPINPAAVPTMSQYRLATAGRDRRYGTPDDGVTALRSAVYDATTRTITLTPRTPFRLSATANRLTIHGDGLLDGFRRPIDGDRDGKPGGTFTADLTSRGVTIR
jgi:cyclophilin family peptidyl-prolyl cis-trans isomerase